MKLISSASGHAECASVEDATFSTCWSDIRDTLVRLRGVKYKSAIDNLETECMDPESEDHYKELLSQWKKDEYNVKDQLCELGTGIKNVIKRLDDLKSSNKEPKMESKYNLSWNFLCVVFCSFKANISQSSTLSDKKKERLHLKSSMR